MICGQLLDIFRCTADEKVIEINDGVGLVGVRGQLWISTGGAGCRTNALDYKALIDGRQSTALC